VSVLFLLDNSSQCLYAKCDKDGRITYRNELFKSTFNHIKPTEFKHLVSDNEDQDEVDAAFKWTDKHKNLSKPFNCRTIQRNGVYRWVGWEVFNLSGEYHLTGVLLFDVVSATSHKYEKIKKQLEDITAFISHEFRQPLKSVVGLIGILQQIDKKSDPVEYDKVLQMIKDSASQLDDVFIRAIERGQLGENTY
jgi:hypothetical protein